MKKKLIILSLLLFLFSGCGLFYSFHEEHSVQRKIVKKDVLEVMNNVAYWQIEEDYEKSPVDFWVVASMFVGMTEYAKLSNDQYLWDRVKKSCESVDWKMGKEIYHADFQAIGQTYLMFYEIEKDPDMLADVKARCDYILANPSKSPLAPRDYTRWDWCDSLFMSPPVWAKLSQITGDQKYLEFMNKEFKFTTDFLYDEKEDLYYRDYRFKTQLEKNGQKVFWSRGNGWVFAGICRILESMPKDHPQRKYYEEIFVNMAYKIAAILPKENLWHASLLDTVNYPNKEASGSAFFLYGFAWGVNNGLLDRQYFMPTIHDVWFALTDCVHEDGKLGYVQEIGDSPTSVDENSVGQYGVGAFLLAGIEMSELVK